MKGSILSFLVVAMALAWQPLHRYGLHWQNTLTKPGHFELFSADRKLPDIVLPAEATPVELAVAQDLARILAAMSGQPEPALRRESWRNQHSGIHVGNTRAALLAGLGEGHLFDRLVHDVGPKRILLYGQDDRATELSVYSWLRSGLGVRWFMPGPDGEFIPTLSSLKLPVARTEFTPSYISRRTDFNGRHREAANLWARRNGMREFFAYNHNLHRIFNMERFREEPGLFALVGGTRLPPRTHRPGDGANPDFSNPRVAELTAEAALEYFRNHPNSLSFSIAPNDSHTFGEYPEDFPHFDRNRFFRGLLDYSDAVFAFSNAVAEIVMAEFPDRFLGTLSYADYENVPSFRVHPRIVPFLTADRSQWYDPAFIEDDKALVRAWVANGPEIIGFWDYFFGSAYMIPRLAHGPLVDSIRFMHEAGVRAYFSQMGPIWGFDAWKAYVMLNLLWDVNFDVAAEWQLFLQSLYGPAAPHMQAFLEKCEAVWMAQPPPAHWIKYYHNNHQAVLFSDESMIQLRGYLQAALASELNERQRAAVTLSSDAFAVTEAFVRFMRHQWELDELSVSNRTEFAHAVAAITLNLQLRAELEALSRATRDTGNLGLNAALSDSSWVFYASPIAKVSYRAARWIQQSGRPEDVHSLIEAVSAWDNLASLRVMIPVWANAANSLEIIQDGGFESGSLQSFWIQQVLARDGAAIRVTDTQARSGRYSVAFHQAALHSLEQAFSVTPGTQLTVSAHVKGNISDNAFVQVDMTWFEADWKRIRADVFGRLPPQTDEDWREILSAGVAPANAAFVRVRFLVINMLAGDVLYLDDFSTRIYGH